MKTLLLIDASSLIHRAFHALPPFSTKEGKPTGALYGLSNILLKILREDKPDFIAAFFDRPEPTFRKEIFEEYKIHRPKAPDELVSQIIESRELFGAFGIKTFEAPGFEADDLIGSAVKKFEPEENLKIVILSGDLDTLQLVRDDKVVAKVLIKGVSETASYDEEAVRKRYGISPEELPEYKALVGDSSDNIPGVKGIGPKTASALIQRYSSLEGILERGAAEKNFPKIESQKEQALLARKLTSISKDAPLEIDKLDNLMNRGIPEKNLAPYFEKLGFQSLIKRIENQNKLF